MGFSEVAPGRLELVLVEGAQGTQQSAKEAARPRVNRLLSHCLASDLGELYWSEEIPGTPCQFKAF